MTWRALFFGCWFEHGEMIRERRKKKYHLVCDRCGTSRVILPGQKLKVRKHIQVLHISRRSDNIQSRGLR